MKWNQHIYFKPKLVIFMSSKREKVIPIIAFTTVARNKRKRSENEINTTHKGNWYVKINVCTVLSLKVLTHQWKWQ